MYTRDLWIGCLLGISDFVGKQINKECGPFNKRREMAGVMEEIDPRGTDSTPRGSQKGQEHSGKRWSPGWLWWGTSGPGAIKMAPGKPLKLRRVEAAKILLWVQPTVTKRTPKWQSKNIVPIFSHPTPVVVVCTETWHYAATTVCRAWLYNRMGLHSSCVPNPVPNPDEIIIDDPMAGSEREYSAVRNHSLQTWGQGSSKLEKNKKFRGKGFWTAPNSPLEHSSHPPGRLWAPLQQSHRPPTWRTKWVVQCGVGRESTWDGGSNAGKGGSRAEHCLWKGWKEIPFLLAQTLKATAIPHPQWGDHFRNSHKNSPPPKIKYWKFRGKIINSFEKEIQAHWGRVAFPSVILFYSYFPLPF